MFVGFYFSLVCSSTARYESDLKELIATSFPCVRRFRGVGMLLISFFYNSLTCKVKLKLIEMQAVAYHILDRADGIHVLNWMYLINQSTVCIWKSEPRAIHMLLFYFEEFQAYCVSFGFGE